MTCRGKGNGKGKTVNRKVKDEGNDALVGDDAKCGPLLVRDIAINGVYEPTHERFHRGV